MSFIYTELNPDFVDDGSDLAEAVKRVVREARKKAGMEPEPRAAAKTWREMSIATAGVEVARIGEGGVVASQSGESREGHEDEHKPAVGPTKENGQHEDYWVLSADERAKGFVRPVRHSYLHVGVRPKHPTRPVTPEELERGRKQGKEYVLFEEYPESESPVVGRSWTQEELDSGCGASTRMSNDLAETFARQPRFYSETFCVGCGVHKPVAEFRWEGYLETVGS